MCKDSSKLRQKSLWFRAVRSLAIAYLVVVVAMTFLERWLVYPAPPAERADWTPLENEHEEVWLTAQDGVKTHGWFYETTAADRVVLYCHGNGECVADNHSLMRLLRDELNASVLIFDYRGYGLSQGQPHESGVIADGHAAQQWLANRTERSPEEIVLVGRSLGGGVAVALAAEQGAAALVLQSTFTRLTDAAANQFPFLPVHWVMRNRFNSIQRLADYKGPLLISHGSRDEVVPAIHAQRLLEASKSPQKRLIDLGPINHNAPQPKPYYEQLRNFLAECGV